MNRPLRILAIKVVTGPSEAELSREVKYLQSFAGAQTTVDLEQVKVGVASVEHALDVATVQQPGDDPSNDRRLVERR